MAPRTLAALSTVLASAGNVSEALNALSQDIAEHDRNGNIVLFMYDARRDLLAERLMPAPEGMRTAQLEIAVDHLPSAIRRTISAGKQFADLGPESGDYQKLLGTGASPEAGVLLLRGLLVDGELAGVLALSEPKTRFGHRLSEKVAPAVDLFSLAFARLAERRAREEAVRTLEELTKALNEENARALQDLQRKLAEARSALNGKGGNDSIRVSQLKRAIEVASVEARATAERLSAVEEQVRVAVTKLEKAHVQLHAQGEALQNQSNIIYRVEQALRDATAGRGEPRKILEEVLQIVTSKEQASSL
jgi:hypothetical protein